MSEVRTRTAELDRNLDMVLLAMVLFLLAFGIVMVLSASGIMAERFWHDKYFFFKRQVLYAAAGLGAMAWAYFTPRDFWHRHSYVWLLIAFALLAATLVPGIGTVAGGARRWLRLGPASIQPLEPAKVALVFYLAYFFSAKQDKVKTFSVGFLPPVAMTGAMCLLLLAQPDFGGAVLLAGILFLMSLVGGTRFLYLGSSLLLGLAGAWALVLSSPYRFKRLAAFLDPFENARTVGYQIVQSLYAFGSGGVAGAGLGSGRQKLLFLPEAHNDFIMAVAGEELGFAGVTLFFICMGVLLWRAFTVALRQKDDRDRLLGTGMAIILCLGAVLNMAVVLGAAPPKGVPMPFVSYGGSHVVVACFCVGILLNLSREEGS